MESCHSVKLPPLVKYVPHPPTYHRLPPKIYSTLGQLMDILEQLSSREDLSSLLQSIVADGDELSPAAKSRGSRLDLDPATIIKVAQILRNINANGVNMATENHGTTNVASSAPLGAVSVETPGTKGGERAQRAIDGHMSLSKQDSLYLAKKIRDFEQKCKPLQEKNKKFLEKNMELTSQNSNLKEQIRSIAGENKKMKEMLETCRRKCSLLTKQLSTEKQEKGILEEQVQELDKLRTQFSEQAKLIECLRLTLAEKDRRVEVLQHRKQRRLRMSAEHLTRLSSPCSGVDDDRSVDSSLNLSLNSSINSSISASAASDDDFLESPQEQLAKERQRYKDMMKEHLSLQKSMAQLQGMLGYKSDPQRYLKMKTDFETDLYIAQCKIENLEECLEKYKDSDQSWVKEKEELSDRNQKLSSEMNTLSSHYQAVASENLALKTKMNDLEDSLKEINRSYDDAVEQLEQMEFLVLETQECKQTDVPVTCTVATTTDDLEPAVSKQDQKTEEPQAVSRTVAPLHEALNMAAGNHQQEYRATIHGLEEKLTRLLQGQGSEVNTVLAQLRQAEGHVEVVEQTMQELQGKIQSLQEEKAELSDRLARYKTKLDSQEQDLSLTRDEREELLQVKTKGADNFLNCRLRLAEMGQDSVRGRSLERERSQERSGSPSIPSPSPRQPQQSRRESLVTGSNVEVEAEESFVAEVSHSVNREPVSFGNHRNQDNQGNQSPRRSRIHSVPVIGSGEIFHFETSSEVDILQKQITELREENDVLKYELMQKCDHDSDASGSDSEDMKLVELRETIENLRERLQSSEMAEKQLKERLKLAEKHITELELGDTVLRDRVEEGNADCDKLRKQIVRLQRKIRELKEVTNDKEVNEQALTKKLKFLEEAESLLSQKVTELEGTNQILQQRLDLKEELLSDVHLIATLKEKVTQLETENNDLGSKVIDLEEDNEILRDNWSKVADEEANRRECLEEKIRILEIANSELKEKLKESESDLNVSNCPSIASELNEDAIEQLNLRIKELEQELEKCAEEKNEKIASLQEQLDNVKSSEIRLGETLVEMENSERQLKLRIAALETSAESRQAASQILSYEDKIVQLRSSQEDLLEKMDSMEEHEDDLKERLIDMEKSYEKKLEMLEREIAEFQQQEDDLCVRIQELEEIENIQAKKIEALREAEEELNKRIEEYENREMDLTVSFSNRIEALEQNDKEVTEKFSHRIQELESKEGDLHKKIETLEKEKQELLGKVSELEKHEKELSEKVLMSKDELIHPDQENSELRSKTISSNGTPTLQLQNTIQTFAKVSSDVTASLKLNTQEKEESDKLASKPNNIEVEMLNEEIMKLTKKLEESEKEQKSLTDRIRKIERKRKKSQRTDNLDDYDTLAREVVTFKLEVDQLRTENSDLHDRLIELDESEKVLLEKNEELTNELARVNTGRETELLERISELEKVEVFLKNEIASIREGKTDADSLQKQHSFDSAYGSNKDNEKETSDKQVGTDDFLEGVMGNQEQGKPVSSMFCRIQTLETENQELSAKLSVLTATDAQVRHLSEKVKGLEENEDSLMERVMELEEEEDRLNRELQRARKSIESLSEIEEELHTLQETEKNIKQKVEELQSENSMLQKTIENSGMEKGDIAVRYASVQKLYEDEKKKVESLLKGEERWMKSTASDKKVIEDMEQELANTQEKLEELQTEYENKLSQKDDREKALNDEINKLIREKEMNKKKMQEYANSNSELEDEIEACKISESRMFHKHQQLITQNQELELKVSKLLQYLPAVAGKVPENVIETLDKTKSSLMSENPDLVSESPLTVSIFSDKELDLLRSKTPDTELLGSVPLDMLRKMEEFDQRETNYQTKIQEYESKNAKLVRSVKVLQGREKDLKHEIKELQIELLNFKEPTSSLRASTSSIDLDRSGSDEGLDSCDNLSTEGNDDVVDIFKFEEKLSGTGPSQYDKMSRDQLLLSVKLFEEKQGQELKKLEDLEEWVSTAKDLLKHMVEVMVSEPLETYIQSVEAFKDTLDSHKDISEDIGQPLLGALEGVTSLRQRLQALQNSEERLRLSLAETELMTETRVAESENRVAESEMQIKQLETQISLLEQLHNRNTQESKPQVDTVDIAIQPDLNLVTRVASPDRSLQLEASKTITIDVPPQGRIEELYKLTQSETITVNVTAGEEESEEVEADTHQRPIMMEKAEDVLRQRIKELEKLEKHLKQQVQDLESDREELHDIARKDKNIIHEQNVRLRELQLSQRNLQEQVKSFETSENTLYNRLDELENEIQIKDDKIRHLEILEQRLKDLVKQYRLDEKILRTTSQTLESSVKEMSDKEVTLKQKLQNLESEKFAFSERSEYLQMRLKELENAEIDLAQRTKNQESIMQSLQNTVMELETFGANAQARVVELEQINFDLQQRLHYSMTENSPLSKQYAAVQQQCDSMSSELSTLRDLEIKLRQENETLMKSQSALQQEVKVLRLKEVELEGKVRDLSELETLMKDKVSKLQRSENTLKYRVQELENSGIQAPSDLEKGITENVKLPQTLEDCQRRIIVLQSHNAELRSRLHSGQDSTGQWASGPNGVSGSLSPGQQVLLKQFPEEEEEEVEELITPTQRTSQEMMAKTMSQGHMLSRDRLMTDLAKGLQGPTGIIRPEDDKWREIETLLEKSGRGSEKWISIGKAQSLYASDRAGSVPNLTRSHGKDEELEVAVTLQSETESQPHSQNDTDSWRYMDNKQAQVPMRCLSDINIYHAGNSLESRTPSLPLQGTRMAGGSQVMDGFGNSLYVQDGMEGMTEHSKELQGTTTHWYPGSTHSTVDSIADSGRGTNSISMATSAQTLRERIAHIERQLSARDSDSAREHKSELDLTSWKSKVNESNRRLELFDKENKTYKDEINKLEHELEEKTRQFLLLDTFVTSVEAIIKDQNISDEKVRSKLEKEVENLRERLLPSNLHPADRTSDTAALQSELAKKDRELNARKSEVESLNGELRQWQAECRTLEDMRSNALDSLRGLEMEISELQLADKQLKVLKEEHNMLKGQPGDVEMKSRSQVSPVVVSALRSKVVQLTNLCNEKDMLIKKLVQELKNLKSGAKSSPLIDELCRLETKSDYNHNQLGRSSSQSSLDSGEHVSYMSDTELIRDSSSTHHLQRPRSADVSQNRGAGHRHSYHGPHGRAHLPRIYGNHSNPASPARSTYSGDRKRELSDSHSTPHRLQHGGLSNRALGHFVAIADYDPSMFSQSGHQRLELSLKEGDLVSVTGALDHNGYYEGEVDGQVGLVPASYLKPAPVSRILGHSHRHPVPGYLNASPERISDMYSHLVSAHRPDTQGRPSPHGLPNGHISGHPANGSVFNPQFMPGPPQVPANFHVEKIIGNSSLLLAWQPLMLDNNGCNNGVKITGYRIFKNNKILAQPRGTQTNKTIVANIDIHAHHRFGIQTVSADGQVSELSEIMYEGVEEVTSDENSDTESEMDMTAVLDMDAYVSGPKRMFMGVYDYDPHKNSPQDHPSCELTFCAGDVITVYGRQRSDGFYHGEINGIRGLVPAFFIEEMPQPPPRTKKNSRKQTSKENKSSTDQQES